REGIAEGDAQVLLRQGGPPLLQIDADAAPAEERPLDEGRPDPAHRVDDERTWSRVLGDHAGRQGREHLAGVLGTPRVVAAGSLVLRRGLGDEPDRKRYWRPALLLAAVRGHELFAPAGISHRL